MTVSFAAELFTVYSFKLPTIPYTYVFSGVSNCRRFLWFTLQTKNSKHTVHYSASVSTM